MRKGRIPSSERLCLCFLWLVLGIEGLMKSGMVRPENDFGLRVAQSRVAFLDGPSHTLRIIGRNEPLLYLRVSIVYMDRSMHRFLRRSCIF